MPFAPFEYGDGSQRRIGILRWEDRVRGQGARPCMKIFRGATATSRSQIGSPPFSTQRIRLNVS